MKKIVFAFFALLVSFSVLADVFVNGYHRKDGTYVKPHYRSNPDGNPYNNWSTKGNVNPYNGKKGSINIYKIQPPKNNLGPKIYSPKI